MSSTVHASLSFCVARRRSESFSTRCSPVSCPSSPPQAALRLAHTFCSHRHAQRLGMLYGARGTHGALRARVRRPVVQGGNRSRTWARFNAASATRIGLPYRHRLVAPRSKNTLPSPFPFSPFPFRPSLSSCSLFSRAPSLGHADPDQPRPSPSPSQVSRSCKGLLNRLVDVDPSRRISAAQALQHPWVRNPAQVGASSRPLPPEGVAALTYGAWGRWAR